MAAAFDWIGFEQSLISGLARPLLVARGSKGYAACAYINLDAAGSLCPASLLQPATCYKRANHFAVSFTVLPVVQNMFCFQRNSRRPASFSLV